MAGITLAAPPIYKSIEAIKTVDGTVTLRIKTRSWVGYTPVEQLSVVETTVTPEDWDGELWPEEIPDKIESDWVLAGYEYPS